MTASNLLATAQVSHSIEYSSGTGRNSVASAACQVGFPLPGGISLSIGRRVSVVVDVGLTQMFRAGILMGLVVVVHGGMIVLVVMGAHHVLPIRPVTLVMDDVSMLMSMDQGVVMVQRQRPRTSR